MCFLLSNNSTLSQLLKYALLYLPNLELFILAFLALCFLVFIGIRGGCKFVDAVLLFVVAPLFSCDTAESLGSCDATACACAY